MNLKNIENLEPLKKNLFNIKFKSKEKVFGDGWYINSLTKSPIYFDSDVDTNNFKCLTITFMEYGNKGDIAFIEEAKYFNKLDEPSIIYEDVDECGVVICGELYTNCTVKRINFEKCHILNDDIKLCVITFKYDDVIRLV